MPLTPTHLAVSAGRLAFTSPGDDLMCGIVARYDVRQSNRPISAANFDQAEPLSAPAPVSPGQTASVTLPAPGRRYLAVRDSLFTFLEHPDAPPDNNGSERDLRPLVVYRKVTGGFRSAWGPDLCAAVASVVGTAARRGIDAYHAIHAVLSGRTVLAPG